jgi:ribonuclease-3
MYGNAFEAFIGAIYLDKGYECCMRFLEEKVIRPYIDLDSISRKEVNFKSKLIEWSQKNKIVVVFELIEQSCDKHYNPVFQTEVNIEGVAAGIGTGYSKKESQQNAAKIALSKITEDDFLESVRHSKEERLSREADSLEAATEAVETEIVVEAEAETEA